jgi:uncharacterized protein YdbL (DUF1318 family)
MTSMNKIFSRLAFLAALLLPTYALAVSIDEAKSQGMVGEQSDGYLGVVADSPDARAVVADINAKRKAKYEQVARDNNLELNAVETLAGQKAIEKTEPGNYIRVNGGAWRKK